MSDGRTSAPVTVDAARIHQLVTALSCTSFGRFDVDAATIEPDPSDDFGLLEGVLAVFIDELALTRATLERAMRDLQDALRDSEEARKELEDRLRVIAEQRVTITELSTPVIDVWDRVITLPIVGTIDSQRAAEMGDRLLDSVSARSAQFVIVDLTGVSVLDTATASHVVRMTQAVRLLGAECILTGIAPSVAQTLVMLGIDLGRIRTMRTLKDGLRYCIAMRDRADTGELDASGP